MRLTRLLVLSAAGCLTLATLAGCTVSKQQVKRTALERAAFDFDCDPRNLRAQQLGETEVVGKTADSPWLERATVGVSGCGQRAVYEVRCTGDITGDTCHANREGSGSRR